MACALSDDAVSLLEGPERQTAAAPLRPPRSARGALHSAGMTRNQLSITCRRCRILSH